MGRIAYRSIDTPAGPSRDDALRAAARWARWRGVPPSAFEQTVECVQTLTHGASLPAPGDDAVPNTRVVDAPPQDRDHDSSHASFSRHRVFYRLATGTASIDTDGRAPPRVVEAHARPLRRRAMAMAAVLLAVGAATGAVHARYVARHAWFGQHGVGAVIALAGVAVAVVTSMLVGELLLGRRALRWRVVTGCLLAIVALVGGTSRVVRARHPTLANAMDLCRHGHFDRADVEASAVDAIEPLRGVSARDEVALARIPADADLRALVAQMRRPWRSTSARARVLQRLRRAAEAEAHAEPLHERWTREHLADAVAEWLPDVALRLRGEAAWLALSQACSWRDARCLVVELDLARRRGVDETHIVRARDDFVARARQQLQSWEEELLQAPVTLVLDDHGRWIDRRSPCVDWIETLSLDFDGYLHANVGVDVAALRRVLRRPRAVDARPALRVRSASRAGPPPRCVEST